MSSPAASWIDRCSRSQWPRLEHAVGMLVASSTISKPLVNVSLAICALVCLRDARAGRLRLRRTPLDGPVLAWVLVSLLAGVTSIDPLRSLRDLRSLGHWSAIYFVAWAAASSARPAWLQDLWLAAGGVGAAQALAQVAFGFDLQGRSRSIPPSGFFGGHLELGHFMVMLLALAIARLAAASTPRETRALLCAVLAFGASLVTCGGRGPWLAFAAVAVTWGVLERRTVALGVLAAVLLLQIGFLAGRTHGVGAFYRSYVTFEADAPEEVEQERVASNRWRVSMWREGLQRFALRPVTGTGIETTGELSQDFRTPFPDLAVAHLHSNYFEILMSRGFFGLAAFLGLMIAALCWAVAELPRHAPGPSRAAVFVAIGALIAHLVHGITQFTFGAAWLQMGFFIALGLAIGEWMRRVPAEEAEPTVRIDPDGIRWAMLTIAVALLATPWILSDRGLAAAFTIVAPLDAAAGWMAGRRSSVEAALDAAFGFVVIASVLLLLVVPGLEQEAVEVILAAGVPFSIALVSLRLRAASGRVENESRWP